MADTLSSWFPDDPDFQFEGISGCFENPFLNQGDQAKDRIRGCTPAVDDKIRKHYRELRDIHGKEYLFKLLQQRDMQAALKIKPNDSVRVIRALEVLEQSGESIIEMQKRHSFADCPYVTYKIGLQFDRKELKNRVALRTEKMVAEGKEF